MKVNVKRQTAQMFLRTHLTIISFFSAFFCLMQEAIADSYFEDPKSKEIYTKYDSLQCDNKMIIIYTLCSIGNRLPFCPVQTIIIFDKTTRTSKPFIYNHPFRSGEQQLINQVSCTRVKGRYYAVLGVTNFGNCNNCEWIDVYSLLGKYEGSNSSRETDSPETYKDLGQSLAAAVYDNKEQTEVDIDRNPN